jgi:hypothetical protein
MSSIAAGMISSSSIPDAAPASPYTIRPLQTQAITVKRPPCGAPAHEPDRVQPDAHRRSFECQLMPESGGCQVGSRGGNLMPRRRTPRPTESRDPAPGDLQYVAVVLDDDVDWR